VYVSAKEVIYDNALELWKSEHPDSKTEPTMEQLKQGKYWDKATKEKEIDPEVVSVPLWVKYEYKQLKQYETNLKKLTSSYPSKIVQVEINKIVLCPILPPRRLGDLAKIAQSIGKVSLLAPLILRKSKEKKGFYEVVCGRRRFEALKIRGEKKAQAKVFDDLPDKYVFAVSASENWHYQPLSGAEWAMLLAKWKESLEWSQRQIAKFFDLTEQEISNKLRLLKLPNQVKNLNAFKFLSVNLGLSLLRIKDSETQIEIMKEFDKVVKKNPYMSRHKLGREFTKIMKEHRKKYVNKTVKFLEKIPAESLKQMTFEDFYSMLKQEKIAITPLTQMLVEDFCQMMQQETRTVEEFAKYFWDACFRADVFEEYYYQAFHYVEIATGKKVADVSLDINLVEEEIVVDINSYKEKDSGKWVPFELRFKSYRL